MILLLQRKEIKSSLLRVLDYPLIPLHTNQSESDISEVVKKRKVSFGTQSFADRQCRDTFISLKKLVKNKGSLSGNIY